MLDIISHSQWYKEDILALKNINTPENSLSMLYSFWYSYNMKKKKFIDPLKDSNMISIRKYLPKESKLFIDSGVFSARKLNHQIPTKELIDFYNTYNDKIDFIFGNDEGTAQEQISKNQEMLDASLPVIPIYHFDVLPLNFIDYFYDQGVDFFGVSYYQLHSKYGAYSDTTIRKIDQFMEYVYKRFWPLKLHLLGVETMQYLNRYPAYSTDSSNIVNTFSLGKISHYDKKGLKIDRLHPRNEPLKSLKKDINSELYIEEYGIKYLNEKREETRIRRTVSCIQERFKFQKLLTDIWSERGVVWND